MKIHTALLASLAAALFLYAHMGCAAVREGAWPAAGAATGAAVGFIAPPFGPIIGAGVGAAIVAVTNQNDELRDGTLQGDGAGDREIEHLRQEIAQTRGALSAKVERVSLLNRALAELWFWIKVATALFIVYEIVRSKKGRRVIGSAFRFLLSRFTLTATKEA